MNKTTAFASLLLTATLTACGGGGSTPSAAAIPTVNFTVDNATIASGGSATLSWTSTGATACTAAGSWTGGLATSGTQSTGPMTAPATYSITCTSGSASSSASSVTVNITPTATLTAAPASVASGSTSTLTWSSANATACTASGAWTGAQATSGSFTTPALTAASTYTLTCSGAGGTSAPANASVAIATAQATVQATVTILATPTSVTSGGTSTLTWSSTNATACTASGAWTGAKATSGSFTTTALTAAGTYTLTCSGAGATSAVASATVAVTAGVPQAPTVSLTAAPSGVTSGGTSTLTWSSTNATACTASGGWTGAKAVSGTLSTGALAAAKTYTLTCTGAGGSANASATIPILAATLTPHTVALVTGQTKAFSSTLATAGSAAFSVDGVANGNATVGTVSSTGVYTAGTATGAHTILATSTTDATQTQNAKAIVTDLTEVSTFHQNNMRTGANTQEYALTTASVTAATFGKLAACTVDGAVVAQPLWVANVTIGGAVHNVVYVATMHDGLYAIDADAAPCDILWHAALTDATHGAAAGETSVPWTSVGVPQGDSQPEIGITGTPVIDTSTRILYVVSATTNADATAFHTRLHAIDMTTGSEKTGSPVEIAGSVNGVGSGGTTVVFNSQQELQRTGLALVNNANNITVYVAFTAYEDAAPWWGWVFGYTYSGTAFTQASKYNTVPNHHGGGIWMSGGAPAVDSSGDLYVVTGNGQFGTADDSYGDSMLKFTPTLALSQYWTPMDQADDNALDYDFGSGGATVLADLPTGAAYLHVILCGGKDGYMEVLNRDMLGSMVAAPVVQEVNLAHPLFSTPAFWNNHLYVAAAGGKLTAFNLNTTSVQFTQSSVTSTTFVFPGATPTISASGTTNGVAWAMETNAYCTHAAPSCGPLVLHALDANNLATELWNSSAAAADTAGYAVKFIVPTVANGHVYVGTRGNNTGTATSTVPGTLEIYGLKP